MTWEAFATTQMPLTGCTSATIDPSAASSVVGSTVLFTAASDGCPSPQYAFRARYPDGKWHVVQGFGASSSVDWNTSGLAPGAYRVDVWANQKGASVSSAEAFASSLVTLTGCTSASIQPGLAIGEAGTTVVLVAGSGGCPNPQFQFRFRALDGPWRVVQGFSDNATVNWNTKGLAPGAYTMQVWANQRGASRATYEAIANAPVTLTGCATTTVAATPASLSVSAGTAITISASSTGCINPVYELWVRDPSKVWHLLWKFTSGALSVWKLKTTTKWPKGYWVFQVWANGLNSDYSRWQSFSSTTRKIT